MSSDRTERIGIILNGVTGRMGANQHLRRSLLEIRRGAAFRCPTAAA